MVKPLIPSRALVDAQTDKRIEILQLVGLHGSISEAARVAGVSYKAAWQAIHTLSNLAGQALVDSSVGGTGGGGARLTAAGTQLLDAAAQMEAARREVLARFDGSPARALAGPRTSMRNLMPCRVLRLESADARDPLVRVVLALAQGVELASSITRESAELLNLAPGADVLALCKATAVRVQAASVASTPAPATHALAGRVLRVARGVQRDEVVVTLPGDIQLVGFAARPNALRAGSRAVAWVEDSAVVLALAD